jgi:glycosyltransferase involved in cell wall biosynthesis
MPIPAPRVDRAVDRRIKVTYVITSLSTGGTQKHLYDLVRLLDRREFDPSVIVFQGGGYYYQALKSLRIPILNLEIDSLWDAVRQWPRFARYVRKEDVDVLHVVLPLSSLYGCLIRFIDLRRRHKILLSMRSLQERMDLRHRAAYRHILMRCPDAITAVCESVGRRCVELGADPRAVRVIRNGISLGGSPPRGQLRRQLNLDDRTIIVGAVGSLTPRKNHSWLLRSVPEMLSVLPNLRVVVLGEGILRKELEAEIEKLGIGPYVHLPGLVTPASDYLRDFDVFVLPSLEEGTSNALLEAMAIGLPCVASDIASNREVITPGETGLLAPLNDTHQLAESILQVLRDEALRRKLSTNAQTTVGRTFRSENMAAQNEQLYRSLLVVPQHDLEHRFPARGNSQEPVR